MEDETDLYGDLDDAFTVPLEKDLAKTKQDEEAKVAAEKALTEKINKLQSKLDEMTEKYQTLNNNTSYLLETAREELARKNTALKDWQRKWDDLMFRKKKSTRSVWCQTDFQPEHRSRDRSRDRRKSSHRSPEKHRRHDEKGSGSDREQKYRKSEKGSSKEQEQKYRGSHRDERPKRLSSDPTRDSARDSRSRAKRSRSKSPRRLDEKRRKLDEQRPSHKELKSVPDLRQALLKKQANRSSPRKPKTETAVIEKPPKIPSPRKRKTVQSQEGPPVEALSIKSSDSEVEFVSVVSSTVPSKSEKKENPAKSVPQEVSQKEADSTKLVPNVEDEPMPEAAEIIQKEETVGFHPADEGSKSPKLTELESEILAAESFSLENEVVIEPDNQNSDKTSMQESNEQTVAEFEKNSGAENAIVVVEPSSASVQDEQEPSAIELNSSKAQSEAIIQTPIEEIAHKISPVKLKSSPIKAIASQSVPENAEQEPQTTDQPSQADKSFQEPQPTLNGTLDSSGASKENSLNKSQKKKKRASKTYEKEVQEDGTVVFVITSHSKKKKKKEKSKA